MDVKSAASAGKRIALTRGMEPLLIVTGGVGLFVSARFGEKIDVNWRNLATSIRERVERNRFRSDANFPELLIVGRIIAALRAGRSLDQALEILVHDPEIPSRKRKELRLALDRRPTPDFLSEFLSAALGSGAPILQALVSLHRTLLTQKKMKLRAKGLSAQCRAQAEVLTWLPWCLALALFTIEPTWFSESIRSPLTWLCWSLASALCGGGKFWVLRISRNALVAPTRENYVLEEEFPELVLRVSTQISLGRDPISSLEEIQVSTRPPLRNWLTGSDPSCPPIVKSFSTMIKFASENGAPIRDDLANFLSELQTTQETRWEERLQRLPVQLLAPLFACFFPACILVVLSLLLPILRGAL